MKIAMTDIAKLLLGSHILGCGGGGDPVEGEETAVKALELGEVELITLDELKARGEEGVIVTISGVGSPASETAYYDADVYPVIIKALQEKLDQKIIGFIACEIGGSSTFEPFIPAALLGVPVIDAPCDGRAHPLGLMGALGLEKIGDPVWQTAAGGRKEDQSYLEVSVCASVEKASGLIRNAASAAGGAVAVARNPVSLSHLETSGARGAYCQAMELGAIWGSTGDPAKAASAVADALHGEVICRGTVSDFVLHTENALDSGSFTVTDGDKKYTLYFFNEYMAIDADGQRRYTFPDPIITVDAKKGTILATADIRDGLEVTVLAARRENVVLGKGLRYRAGYETIESILHIDMLKYIKDILLD